MCHCGKGRTTSNFFGNHVTGISWTQAGEEKTVQDNLHAHAHFECCSFFGLKRGIFKNGEAGGEPLGQGREPENSTYAKICTNRIWVRDLDRPRPHLVAWGLGLGALTTEPQLCLQVTKLIGNISNR